MAKGRSTVEEVEAPELPAAASGPSDGRRLRAMPKFDDGREQVMGDGDEREVGAREDLPTGRVLGCGPYAVGNAEGTLFAVGRRCRHLGADLANGQIDDEGRLVCPWHQSAYDVTTGRMVRGPQGVFAKVPGLGAGFRALTRVLPLRRGQLSERDGRLYVR